MRRKTEVGTMPTYYNYYVKVLVLVTCKPRTMDFVAEYK